MRDIRSANAFRRRLVAALPGIGIDFGKHPLLIVDGDRGDPITTVEQEFVECSLGFEVSSGVEEGMAEILQPLASLLEKSARDCFAANDVGLIAWERSRVEVEMRKRMIP